MQETINHRLNKTNEQYENPNGVTRAIGNKILQIAIALNLIIPGCTTVRDKLNQRHEKNIGNTECVTASQFPTRKDAVDSAISKACDKFLDEIAKSFSSPQSGISLNTTSLQCPVIDTVHNHSTDEICATVIPPDITFVPLREER